HTGNEAYILVQLLCIAALAGVVVWWRWRFDLRAEAGMLALSVAWILFSPHLFPWYMAALLPLLALYLGNGKAATALWIFVLCMPFTYSIFTQTGTLDNVFLLFFIVPAALLAWNIVRRHDYRAFFAEVRATWNDVAGWLHPSYSLPAEE
ncbi:MAG TPA: hypothetical protein VKB76_01830, partial [Ktedonobacterales bacterium]|nr:hypothetical protein [Ktedonobacterales bacterium]